MCLIALESLSKWYGEVIGLNDVTASLKSGITGLVGPNGAGKSTLMGLIMGQLRPSRGVIRVFGENPWNDPRVLSRIGYCPEGDPFWFNLTGYAFVNFLAKISGLSGQKAKEATLTAIERTGMTDNMHRPIRTYSKGMRQRIKFAQALVHEPELLVLDEPFSGMDPIGRHRLTEDLKSLAARGVAVLIASHVLHEVEALTRKILMIDHGRIVATGDVGEIREEIRDRPHAIRVVLDQPRRLASTLSALEIVTALKILGDSTLVIETRDPNHLYDQIVKVILQERWKVKEIAAADKGLEALFEYLTEK